MKSLDLFLKLGDKIEQQGISNLSSRCYLCVNLVQIYSCLPLRQMFQSNLSSYCNHIDGKEVDVEFESLFKQMSLIMKDMHSREFLNIDHLCDAIKVFNVSWEKYASGYKNIPLNDTGRHEDPSEVLSAMFYPIHKAEYSVFSIKWHYKTTCRKANCQSNEENRIHYQILLPLTFSDDNNDASLQSMVDARISLMESEPIARNESICCDKCHERVYDSPQKNELKTKDVLIFQIHRFGDKGEKLSTQVDIDSTIVLQGNKFALCSVIIHCCEGEYTNDTGGHFVILYTLTGKLDDLLCMDDDDIYKFERSAMTHPFVKENAFLVTYWKINEIE